MKYFDLTFQSLTDKDGSPVREVQLFKKGTFEKAGTEFTIDDEWLEAMVKNFEQLTGKAKDKRIIPLDYNHASMNDHHEEAIAAGWLLGLKKKDDGLYGEFEFTPRAAEYVKNKEYRYISPEFNPFAFKTENGEIVEVPLLQAAALTNRPFLKGMAPVELNDRGSKKTNKEDNVNQLEKIGKVLSLSGEFGEKDVLSAIETISKPAQEIRSALKLSDKDDVVGAVKNLIADNEAKKTEVQKLNEKVDGIVKAQKESEAKSQVKQLLTEGKLTPDQEPEFLKLAIEQPEMFGAIKAKLPVIVSFKTEGQGGENPNGQSVDGDVKKQMNEAVLKCMNDDKLDYGQAFNKVQKANPELASKYSLAVSAK